MLPAQMPSIWWCRSARVLPTHASPRFKFEFGVPAAWVAARRRRWGSLELELAASKLQSNRWHRQETCEWVYIQRFRAAYVAFVSQLLVWHAPASMPRKNRLSRKKGTKHSPNDSLISKINKAIADVDRGVSKKEACKSASLSRYVDVWNPSNLMCINSVFQSHSQQIHSRHENG